MNDSGLALRFSHLAAHVFNVPLMIESGKLDSILGVFMPRMLGLQSAAGAPFVTTTEDRARRRDLFVSDSGIAVIDVLGTLTHEVNGLEPWSGMTPYQSIALDFESAQSDSGIKGLLFRINSPGGHAQGVWELADAIATSPKPTAAIVADLGASAAYMIAAACDYVFCTQGAMVGSIGVIGRHLDRTAADKEAGLKITNLYRGARKADGAEPLTDESRAHLMTQLDSIYDLFVSKVSTFRGLDRAAVIAQESKTFPAALALQAGLVDGIRSEVDALAFLSELTAGNGAAPLSLSTTEDSTMSKNRLMVAGGALLATTALASGGVSGPVAPTAPTAPTATPPASPSTTSASPSTTSAPAPAATPAPAPADEKKDGEDDEEKAPPADEKKTAATAALVAKIAAESPDAVAAIRAAERGRVLAILGYAEAGEDSLASSMIESGVSADGAAAAFLTARKEARAKSGADRIAARAAPVVASASPVPPAAAGVPGVAPIAGDLRAAFNADAQAQKEFGGSDDIAFAKYKAWTDVQQRKTRGRAA